MYKKIYAGAAAILFALLLIGSPALKIADSAGIYENKDLGNVIEEPVVYEGTGVDGLLNSFEAMKYSLNDIYTNFMPAYYETVFTYGKVVDTIDAPLLSLYSAKRVAAVSVEPDDPDFIGPPLPDPDKVVSAKSTLIATSQQHRNYLVELEFEDGANVAFLDTAVNMDSDLMWERVGTQADLLNGIANANDDVNFYFMLITRMQDTDYFGDIIAGEDSTKEYVDAFMGLLDEKIIADRWDIGSARDRSERVFLTDHHWSAYGSYLGFCQLCGLICPDWTPVELGEPVSFPDSRFFGSFARISQYTDIWDVFKVYDYDMGPYTCDPAWDFDKQVAYLSKQQYLTPDKNIYAIFHPEIYQVDYPENNTGRNLLVLGDSYTQGFAQLLGSAFDTTVIRYYTGYAGLDYNAIIKKYNITDVLFMQFSDRILFDLYGDDQLATIKIK